MTNPVRKSIPTSAQILKEQKERADREREARLAAGRKAVAPQPAAKQPQDEIERLTGQVHRSRESHVGRGAGHAYAAASLPG